MVMPTEPIPDIKHAPHGWTFDDGQWRAKKSPGRPRINPSVNALMIQCIAISRSTKQQCKRFATPEDVKCHHHGGIHTETSITRKCIATTCDKDFTLHIDRFGRTNKRKQYCSLLCWKSSHPEEVYEQTLLGAQASAKVMITKYRGTTKSSGKSYIKENQRHQHRVVAERLIGRSLIKGEVVHHEDLNQKNNDPDNLIIFVSQAQHARHHGRGHPEGRNLPCDCTIIKKLT